MKGPKQVPTESESFDNWQDHSLPEKTSSFEYKDSTSDHIGGQEDQKFDYGRTDFPEKM